MHIGVDDTTIRPPNKDLDCKALALPSIALSIFNISIPVILQEQIQTIGEYKDI